MILVLLPAFNEEASLPLLVPKLVESLDIIGEEYRFLFCDDGSTDKTPDMLIEYARQYPIEVITHKINRGLGEASRNLFERAAEICTVDDVIIRMDCDDTHEPKYIVDLVTKVRAGFDVVIASRFEKGGEQSGVEGYRALLSRAANLFMKVFFPIKGLKEYSCGYRGYSARKIKEAISFYGNDFIQLKGLGFTCTLEKIIKLKMIGARFGEIPFHLRYDQKVSESKMASSITTLGYLVMTLLYHWPFGGWKSMYIKRYREEVLNRA